LRRQAIDHKAEDTMATKLSKTEFLRRVIFLAREARETEKVHMLPIEREEVDV